ncbi:hypothetical protein ACM0P6_04600 [Komagataeibacter sucrofermentans]|uniref:Uncharacterized protein n=1 Tax=Komagataeibacter sucrofermentans TaxID=1053551 RepID=A0A318QLS4_9PROT|nr:hypothetical protein [Komagataeibacter sucrofermentans]PYD78944.1 hypothetical protein CFR77_08990 [Komagataeibacter sucrofermentans]GBQ46312.1 hypothetical protein AA15973_0862 [Komagataeibacter sucrofermentans DSM 15973]
MFPGVAFLKGGVLSGFWQKGDPEISSVIARYGVVQDWQAVMQWRLSCRAHHPTGLNRRG